MGSDGPPKSARCHRALPCAESARGFPRGGSAKERESPQQGLGQRDNVGLLQLERPSAAAAARSGQDRRAEAVSLFDAGSPFAEAVLMQEQASPAQDAALVRERTPPRGDRRPLSKRNKSREDREAARGAEDTYDKVRAKALSARSKTVPAEVFIGEAPKRSKAVPPNQSALMRRNARVAAVKRDASAPAEDRRVRTRGGAANAERVAVRQKMAENPRLYEDKSGNVKSRRTKPEAKTVNTDAKTKTDSKTAKSKKSKAFSPPQSSRPEDRYGVRGRVQRSKTLGASASRSRERLGLVV